MRGYAGIDLPLSACIHFVRNNEIDASLSEVVTQMHTQAYARAYIDCSEIAPDTTLVDSVAKALCLDHAPYQSNQYVAFLDDLITLSNRTSGLLIVLDHASVLLEENSYQMFDLIESFLIQFHHWFEKKKPCHLCFQMESNDIVRRIFAR